MPLIDKQTKLEGIRDNLELVATRMVVLRAEREVKEGLPTLLRGPWNLTHAKT